MNSNSDSIQNNLNLDETNPCENDLAKIKQINESDFTNNDHDSDTEFEDVDQNITTGDDLDAFEIKEGEEDEDEFFDFDDSNQNPSSNFPCTSTSANLSVSSLATGLEKLLLKQKM